MSQVGVRRLALRFAIAAASVVALFAGTAISASADDPGPSSFAQVGPVDMSTPIVGSRITAGTGVWSPNPTSYEYQWYFNGAPIDGETNYYYTVTPDEQGGLISVSMTGILAGYTPTTSTSPQVTVLGDLTNTGASISGTWAVGQVVTADPGTWNPPNPSLTYIWRSEGVNSTVIASGPDATSITLTDADVYGVWLTIRGTLPGYATGSSKLLTVPPFLPDKQLPGRVTITGTAARGYTLTASTDNTTWDPTDLIQPYQYQWNRNGVAISGATASTYVLTTADVGASITATITAGSSEYAAAPATSSAVIPITGTAMLPTPTLSGTPELGDQLIATEVSTAYTRQYGYSLIWFVNGVRQGTGVNGNWFYPLSESQVGGTVTVEAESFPPGGPVYSDPSPPTAPIQDGTIHPVGITVDWNNELEVNGVVAPTLTNVADNQHTSYEIYRDGVAVSSYQYPLTVADWHHSIQVVATESVPGFAPVVTRSKPIVVGDGQFLGAPVTPTGYAHVGKAMTIDVSSLIPKPTRVSYWWYVGEPFTPNYVVVSHSATFVPPASDLGKFVWSQALIIGPHVGSWDNNTDPVRIQPGILPTQSAPTISGSAFTGSAEYATHSNLAVSGVAYHYQWYSASSATAPLVAIAHATSSSYVPSASLKGRVLAVRITATKTDYSSESTYSVRTRPLLSPTALQVHPLPPHAGSVPTGPAFL